MLRMVPLPEKSRGGFSPSLPGQRLQHVHPVVDIVVEGADRQPLVAAVGAFVVGEMPQLPSTP